MSVHTKIPAYYLVAFETAYNEAQIANDHDEVPVGAVIVRNGSIIAVERNRILEMRDPTAHAEILVIRKASEIIQNERLTDCELFTTLEPCVMCSGAIIMARIPVVYYLTHDEKLPGLRSVITLERHNHIPEVQYIEYPDIPARELLRNFFQKKRQLKSGMGKP